MLKRLIPYIQGGRDFDRSIAFYVQTLGFVQRWRSIDMAILVRDDVEFFLQNYENLAVAEWTMIRVEVTEIDAYYAEVQASGIMAFAVDVTQPSITPLADTLWNTREFAVRDWAGCCLQFFETQPS